MTIRFKNEAEARKFGIKVPDPDPPPASAPGPLMPIASSPHTISDPAWYAIKMGIIAKRDEKIRLSQAARDERIALGMQMMEAARVRHRRAPRWRSACQSIAIWWNGRGLGQRRGEWRIPLLIGTVIWMADGGGDSEGGGWNGGDGCDGCDGSD